MAYFIQKELDPKLIEYGRKIVAAFGMKERFFHIEFFKMPDGDYIALEYNNRLAGNYAVDLYNFAHSINLFEEYANMVLGLPFQGNPLVENQFCAAISQRDLFEYVNGPDKVRAQYGKRVKLSERIPKAFSIPVSCRAKLNTMPRAMQVATKAEPPVEINGSGTPMIGVSPTTAPMFTSACDPIHMPIPPVTIRAKSEW